MKTYFNFCGVNFEIESDKELSRQTNNFKVGETTADVKVKVKEISPFPKVYGKYLGRANEKTAWQLENKIIRRTTDICRTDPHADERYSLDNISSIDVYIEEGKWSWVSTEEYFWTSMCLNQVMLYFNTLFFHASYIVVNGEGILFTAPSQTGKSTQADLWCKYRNAKIINGDKAAVRIDKITSVNSIPFSGTSGICYNVTVPLKAIVYLSQAPDNKVRQMGIAEAVSALCPNVFADKLVNSEWSKTINLLLDLVSSVPIYSLACTPDIRAVEELEKYLYR